MLPPHKDHLDELNQSTSEFQKPDMSKIQALSILKDIPQNLPITSNKQKTTGQPYPFKKQKSTCQKPIQTYEQPPKARLCQVSDLLF